MPAAIYSHRALEQVLRGFNTAYNARRQRVLDGRTPSQVAAERLRAEPKLANPEQHGRAGPCDTTKARLIVHAAKEVSQPNKVTGAVASFAGDGGYDQDRVHAGVAERHPEAAVIVPPRATAVLSETAGIAPTQRGRHLQRIAEHGRMAWQKASGYTTPARAEAAIGRFKQVIGDGLRSRA